MREPMDDGGTGDAQVDEAVRTLDALEGMPVHEHAAVVERVHQVLQDRLAGEPDVAPGDEPGAAEAGRFDGPAAADDFDDGSEAVGRGGLDDDYSDGEG